MRPCGERALGALEKGFAHRVVECSHAAVVALGDLLVGYAHRVAECCRTQLVVGMEFESCQLACHFRHF